MSGRSSTHTLLRQKATSLRHGLAILFNRNEKSLLERLTTFPNEHPYPLALPENGVPHHVLLLLPSLVKHPAEIPDLIHLLEQHFRSLRPSVATQLHLNVLKSIFRLRHVALAHELLRWYLLDKEAHCLRAQRDAAAWSGLFALLQTTPVHLSTQMQPWFSTAVRLYCQAHGLHLKEDVHRLRRTRRPQMDMLESLTIRPDLLDTVTVGRLCDLMHLWSEAPVAPRAKYQPTQTMSRAFLRVAAREGDEPAARMWLDHILAVSDDHGHRDQARLLYMRSARGNPQLVARIALNWGQDPSCGQGLQYLGGLWQVLCSPHASIDNLRAERLRDYLSSIPPSIQASLPPAGKHQLFQAVLQKCIDHNAPQLALDAHQTFLASDLGISPGPMSLALLCQALIQVHGADAAAAAIGWYGRPGKTWSPYESANNSSVIPVYWKGRPPPFTYDCPDHLSHQTVQIDAVVFNILFQHFVTTEAYDQFLKFFPQFFQPSTLHKRFPSATPDEHSLSLYLTAAYRSTLHTPDSVMARFLSPHEQPCDAAIDTMWRLIVAHKKGAHFRSDQSMTLHRMAKQSTLQHVDDPEGRFLSPTILQRRHILSFIRILSLRGQPEDALQALSVWKQLPLGGGHSEGAMKVKVFETMRHLGASRSQLDQANLMMMNDAE